MADDPEQPGGMLADATPEPETPTPATPEGETPAPEPAKPDAAPKPEAGAQRRIDELTREKHDERRKREALEAELAALKRKTEAGPRPQPPDLTKLTDAEGRLDAAKYSQAMVKYEDDLERWRDAQRSPTPAPETPPADADAGQRERITTFLERAEPLKAQHADFEDVINRPVFSAEMREVLWESELGPQLAYYLGSHQAEALRIANLPTAQMYRELGKLEAKLATAAPAPPARTVSNAPEPIAPVASTTSATKDPEKMSTDEWMAWDRQQTVEKVKRNPLGV